MKLLTCLGLKQESFFKREHTRIIQRPNHLSCLTSVGMEACCTRELRLGKTLCTNMGIFHWPFSMTSATVAVRFWEIYWGRWRELKIGLPHQILFQKFTFSPEPISQLEWLFVFSNSPLKLLYMEEWMWWEIVLLFLITLLLRITAQACEEFLKSQHNLRLEASFREVRDLMFNPPWERGLQILL